MGKKDHALNPYEISGPFRILLKDGKLFAGEIAGAWDDAFLLEDPRNGSTILMRDSIVAMMEGLEPPAKKEEGGNQ